MSKPDEVKSNPKINIGTLSKKSFLELVVSNPPPIEKTFTPCTLDSKAGFKARFQKKSPFKYTLYASHPFHYLKCRISLEIHDYDNEDEKEREPIAVVCHFPNVYDDEEANQFIERDDTLHPMLVIQFQLNIMKQLILFCRKKNVSNLMVEVDNVDKTEEGHSLGIYHSLIIYEDKVLTKTGTKIHLVISQTEGTFNKLNRLINRVNRKFRSALWQDHVTNPFVRNYLKSNPALRFFF